MSLIHPDPVRCTCDTFNGVHSNDCPMGNFARYLILQTGRRCAEIAMERCRLLNGDAMAMHKAGRHYMAAAAEMKAEQFVWMTRAISREFDLDEFCLAGTSNSTPGGDE